MSVSYPEKDGPVTEAEVEEFVKMMDEHPHWAEKPKPYLEPHCPAWGRVTYDIISNAGVAIGRLDGNLEGEVSSRWTVFLRKFGANIPIKSFETKIEAIEYITERFGFK